MKVTMMLADFAQAIGGKLYIMGGGWSITGPAPCPSAIAVKIEVPWNQTNQKHRLKVDLLDGDFHPVSVPTPQGQAPMVIDGNFEVGRPAGLLPGTPMDVAMAFNIPPFPLEPGKRYIWKLTVNDKENDEWQAAFSTRPAVQNPL